jgi:hypothetical protein
MNINYERPYLYPKQLKALFCSERYAIIEAATKTGKTHGAIVWLNEKNIALEEGQNCWWVAPVSSQAKIAFERFKRMLRDLITAEVVKVNEVNMTIKYRGAGTIFFKSADNPDSLYGEDVYFCVFDEFNRAKESAFVAIRSTLTATQGQLRLIGNVLDATNWGYKLARKAEKGLNNWVFTRLTAYDASDAGIFPVAEIDDARATLSEDAFNQLYLAIASENNLNPFGYKYIDRCTLDVMHKGVASYYGIDVARKNDYTVVIGMDDNGNVVEFHSFQGDWAEQYDQIQSIIGNMPARIDATGVGDSVYHELASRGCNVEPVVFSLQTKQVLMEDMAYLIQKNAITFPAGEIPDQLKSIVKEYVNRGNIRYLSTADHDDCVMALALACQFFRSEYDANRIVDELSDFFSDPDFVKELDTGDFDEENDDFDEAV